LITLALCTLGGASGSRSSTASKAELTSGGPLRGLAETTSDAVGSSAFDPRESLQLGGGLIITIPPHFGQARICPIAAWSRTFSRDLQVVQVMENRSTVVTCHSSLVTCLLGPFAD
jgi:hypothetical protein